MWFLSWRVMRDMCASCRILQLQDLAVFDTCYWWMHFHQPWVAAHVWESTCVAHWQLSRFYYVRVDSRSIRVTRKILQSMSWWIFLCWNSILYEPSLVLSGDKIRWRQTVVAYSSNWFSASRAILAGICFPPKPWPMTDRVRQDGGALHKILVTLKHHKGYFWCLNVAWNLKSDSIVGGFNNHRMVSPILHWLQWHWGGGGEKEIGEERFWECCLIRSPPKISIFER